MDTLTIDFETYYSKDYSLSKITTQQYIYNIMFEVVCVSVKVNDGAVKNFTGDMPSTARWLNKFDWKNSLCIAHNVLFDGAILAYQFGIIPKMYFCTMMGARPFLAPFITRGRTSLKAVSEHLGIGFKGTEVVRALGKQREDFQPWEMLEYQLYCDNDVELCYKIFKHLFHQFPREELYSIDINIRKYTQPKLWLDQDVLEEALEAHRKHKADILTKAGLTSRELLMSNDKFAAALKLMGVSPPTKVSVKTGKTAYAFAKTDKGLLDLLAHPDPDIQAIVAARMAHKSTIEETRMARFIGVAETHNPLGVPLLYYGAHTGRPSGWDKMNMQNLGQRSALRRAIIPEGGEEIVVGDLSQIECRMAAALAGQNDLLKQFADGVDPYCEFGTTLFQRTITKADTAERFLSKTSILGCQYGVGGEKYFNTVNNDTRVDVQITMDEAYRIVKTYRERFDKIPELWKTANGWLTHMATPGNTDYVIEYGPLKIHSNYQGKAPAIVLPNGMPIWYPELTKGADRQYTFRARDGFRKLWGGSVVENVCQALARIVLNRAEVFLAKKGYPSSLSVHDELVFAITEGMGKKFGVLLDKVLTRPVPWMPNLPMESEVGVGYNYGEAK